MSSNLSSERATVQEPLIKYAEEIGWTYLSPEQALTLRRGESGTLLYTVLRDKLIALNPGIITVENVEQVAARIENVRNTIEGNAETLAWLRGERTAYVESEKRHRNIMLIDFEHPGNNSFHVTDEWQYTNGQYRNRADVMFLVNGVPVAIVETKSAAKKEAIEEGLVQVQRYHLETPEMLTAAQVFNVTNVLGFHYGATWNLDRKDIFNWKDEEKKNFEIKVKRFFSRERFLKLLSEWIVFYKKDDELKKIILRQHQTRAVEKVVERALYSEKTCGLIWHTQGSGKTFTMIKAAEQILKQTASGKPTVIMLVDRNELEGQLSGWIVNVLGEGKAVAAKSKQHLRELLKSDYRGLIVSMIHKFDKADADLSGRNNIFILVDEAHRTTGGDLGNYLVGALPNATMLGFTGTPIDKTAYGKGTFKIFGKEDAKGYLDKYSIAESIEDGTTLELHYALAPNEIRVERELLEREFLNLAEAQGISDIEELNKILDRAVNIKAFLKSNDRIEQVAQFAAKHFKENVEPLGYKAFLVGVDREACALYKKALDKYLPAEYSKIVYTSAHNDSELLKEFKLGEDEEKKIRKAFIKKDTMPKILIVTEKLLTGFDAPILYCMYLDKPMRDHTLLQAIARVNRPYNADDGTRKPSGFVVDFVGIFEKIETALSFDSDEVSGVIKNLDVLKQEFTRLMKEKAPEYLELCKGPASDKTVERAFDAFTDKEARDTFCKFFKDLETLYEIISPDEFLRQYLDDYLKLLNLYQFVRNSFTQKSVFYADVARKTELLVRESTSAYGLESLVEGVEINEETLDALKKSKASDKVKVVNLIRGFVNVKDKEGSRQPFLIPIGERAEFIRELYDDRQMSTQEALHELEKLHAEYMAAKKELKESGFDVNIFSIFWLFKQSGVSKPEDLAQIAEALFRKFPNAAHNVLELRQLKAELYKILMPAVGKDRMVEMAERLLKLPRSL